MARLIDADLLWQEVRDDPDITGRAYEAVKEHILGAKTVRDKTNGDHIRSLPDEGLASFICNLMDCYDGKCPGSHLCHPGTNGLVEWVKQPYEEEKP